MKTHGGEETVFFFQANKLRVKVAIYIKEKKIVFSLLDLNEYYYLMYVL